MAWQQYAMTPKAKGARAMSFAEYLAMLGLEDEEARGPDVTAKDALAIAARIRAADRTGR